ncbi:hypothetical protein BDK51DRAFT_48034 [Blyttiomyces helicus]|uniref:Uncharacterized protein n=1 Tax=Blyttiomyces helicus TaxID=388810 RepID=A0A4P9W028_9FUNG|nr:hypothetical protein BDK51DRAFT_48034 [Blyttiomyces helicus]|eukprot:RKO85414.1 hypothetical protein BDK51DRAFT_48034 [Blyttiomyces helicus]
MERAPRMGSGTRQKKKQQIYKVRTSDLTVSLATRNPRPRAQRDDLVRSSIPPQYYYAKPSLPLDRPLLRSFSISRMISTAKPPRRLLLGPKERGAPRASPPVAGGVTKFLTAGFTDDSSGDEADRDRAPPTGAGMGGGEMGLDVGLLERGWGRGGGAGAGRVTSSDSLLGLIVLYPSSFSIFVAFTARRRPREGHFRGTDLEHDDDEGLSPHSHIPPTPSPARHQSAINWDSVDSRIKLEDANARLTSEIARKDGEIRELRKELLESTSAVEDTIADSFGAGGGGVREAKIIDLAKKARRLTVALERERGRNAQLSNKLKQAELRESTTRKEADEPATLGERGLAEVKALKEKLTQIPDKYIRPPSLTSGAPRLASRLVHLGMQYYLHRSYNAHEIQCATPVLRPRVYLGGESLLGGWHGYYCHMHQALFDGPMRMTLRETLPGDPLVFGDPSVRFRETGRDALQQFNVDATVLIATGRVVLTAVYLESGIYWESYGALTPYGFAGRFGEEGGVFAGGPFWLWKVKGEEGGTEWEAAIADKNEQ